MNYITKVDPNFIYNRFDIMYGNDFELYEISEEDTKKYIPLHINKRTANIGVWLVDISPQAFGLLIETILFEYPSIDKIQARYSLNYYQGLSISNHWKVDLPEIKEEFTCNLSRKTRYNIKWYPKNIKDDLGVYSIQKYSIAEINDSVVEKYFSFKRQTHNTDYRMTPKQYLSAFFVSHCYTLTINDEIQSVIFICDLDKIVYLENLAFNQEFSKYSVGTVLYYYMIQDLIELGKKALYLGDGEQEYKRRFCGINQIAFDGFIYRSTIKNVVRQFLKNKRSFLNDKQK